eukprot:Phypoly_transcript_04037.p1 GENE.Phypoly_transcript_04037~~Phypoly_transcript_04037.p1  ORF type:complete len:638 (+),score=73.12 Phypoly_transcript_04037:344-2257(+)
MEQGSGKLSDIITNSGVVSLRRYFPETPSVIAYFTVKDRAAEASSSSSPPPKSSKGFRDSLYNTCYKLMPATMQIQSNSITVNEPQVYDLDEADVTFRYIAYLKAKPFDSSMLPLVNLIEKGTSGVEQKIQAWLNEGYHYISTTNSDDQSLLHIAAQQSNYGAVKWLVDHKSDLTLKDKVGWTPIYCSLSSGDLRSAYYLAQNGGIQKDSLTANGSNPLHYLAKCIPANSSDTEKFMYILNKCIEVYGTAVSQPNTSNETPLHRAAWTGNIVLAKQLLELVHTISLDPNAKNRRGHTCLHLAVANGNTEVVQFLASHFMIDVPSFDSPGSPHKMCAEVGKPNLMELIPKYGKKRFVDLPRFVLGSIFELLQTDRKSYIRCLRVSKHIRQGVNSLSDPDNYLLEKWAKLEKIERDLQLRKNSPPSLQQPNQQVTDCDYLFKMLVIGDKGAGATTFCNNAIGEGIKFPLFSVENTYAVKVFNVDGKKVKVQLWNKPANIYRGSDDPRIFRGANVIFLVYDPTCPQAIENLKDWQHEIERYASDQTEKIFVASRADIPHRISRQEVAAMLRAYAHGKPTHHSASEELYPIIIESRADKPNIAEEAIKIAAKLKIIVFRHPDNGVPAPSPKKNRFFNKLFK